MKPKEPLLSLKIFPDAGLRTLCDPVETFNAQLREIVEEMFTLMRKNKGIGLAAPQAGVSGQFFVCGIENETLALVNPVILETGKETQMVEGCLSLPGMHVNVTRHDRVYVAALDVRGRRMQYELTGLWARVVQHEMDHLKGILICDHGDNVPIDELKEDKTNEGK